MTFTNCHHIQPRLDKTDKRLANDFLFPSTVSSHHGTNVATQWAILILLLKMTNLVPCELKQLQGHGDNQSLV